MVIGFIGIFHYPKTFETQKMNWLTEKNSLSLSLSASSFSYDYRSIDWWRLARFTASDVSFLLFFYAYFILIIQFLDLASHMWELCDHL